ncbi:prenyltransferase/squalene oxidase repeat-containing protein [Kitasatospora purpeofusca]|uniref:prenyltransferase/squalene oxidase repeat-containing protein n=1 Tax=Kitasatospora purpeofusca TaxID=67352 RepID=UPI0036F18306
MSRTASRPTPSGLDLPGRRGSAQQARQLLDRVDADPWGQFTPSVYETARVHTHLPGFPGAAARVDWLLEQQAPDGRWGTGSAGHRLLPTLSATVALLAQLYDAPSEGRLRTAVSRGLDALRAVPGHGAPPDTAAVELLVPVLLAEVNRLLDTAPAGSHPALRVLRLAPRLGPAHGLSAAPAAALAERLRRLTALPVKWHHCYEALASAVPEALVPPPPAGLLGGSPAATAAWLARTPAGAAHHRVTAALEAAAQRYGGLFPETAPLAAFERLWVLAALAEAGLLTGAETLARRWLEPLTEPGGVRGAPGLAPDADDTAMALLVAAVLGLPHDHDALAPFWAGDHFACYLGEETGSLSANAHALLALGACLPHHPAHRSTVTALRGWLAAQQTPDGHWTDKWHASPLYATSRAATALARHGGPAARPVLRRAARWALRTQHPDGSWGVWGATAEETGYGARILLAAPGTPAEPLARAHAYLARSLAEDTPAHPPLWHDKTLYTPTAVVEAELLATLHTLAARAPAPAPAPGYRTARRPQA